MLTDLTTIKATPLADYIARTAPQVGLKKSGSVFMGLCPFHTHTKNTPSFSVWPNTNTWRCWGACNTGGTIIDYVVRRDNATVGAAIETLAAELSVGPILTPTFAPPAAPPPPRPLVAPPPIWQTRAYALITRSEDHLHRPEGTKALAWLKEKRGLTVETLRHWHVGYNPETITEDAAHWGIIAREKPIYIPRGITFPAIIGTDIWEVKLRQPVGEPKYLPIPRPEPGPVLYGADELPDRRVVVLCEGQPDCLTLWQVARAVVGVATLGAQGYRINPVAYGPLFTAAEVILGVYDNDGKSENGVAALGGTFGRRFVRVPMPGKAKDPNEYHTTGGNVAQWITTARWAALTARWTDPAEHLAHCFELMGDDHLPEKLRRDYEMDAIQLQKESAC